MPITFSGDTFESTNRVVTLCHSLDWALADRLGNVGIPNRSTIEVYGGKNVGKTTFCTSLMGIIAVKLGKNITLLDWEGQSRETIEGILEAQKFLGNVNYMLNKGSETTEDTLERFVEAIMDENQNVALMDSIGAFRPTALMEGKIGDSNMGVFAREMGQFANKLTHASLRWDEPGVVFLTNHVHPTIGSMVQGQTTSGGEKKKYLAHVRIDLKRAYIGNSPVNFGESYLLRGKVDSNRFGFSGKEFYVFIVGGEGIHVGLTAVWDCVIAGHATLSAKSIKDSVVVSMDGQSYGKFRSIFAQRDNSEFFVPFINRLRENDTVSLDESDKQLMYVGKEGERKLFEMMNEDATKKGKKK
jgi:RecA/RadA recombinase